MSNDSDQPNETYILRSIRYLFRTDAEKKQAKSKYNHTYTHKEINLIKRQEYDKKRYEQNSDRNKQYCSVCDFTASNIYMHRKCKSHIKKASLVE